MSIEEKQATLAECNQQMLETEAGQSKTIEMVGPAGRICVPVNQLMYYRERGYAEIKAQQDAAENNSGTGESKEGAENQGNDETDTVVDYSTYTDEHLLEFAKIAGLAGNVKKRETIIAKLTELGFKPETTNE